MGQKIDIANMNFDMLKAICPTDNRSPSGSIVWKCICECGKEVFASVGELRSGTRISCGCKRHSTIATHGNSYHPLYVTWIAMRGRCENPNAEGYENYGGRGITVCDGWQSFEPFMQWALENGYSDGLTIDRQDNDKGYSPDNCRWATRKEQQNNRRTNHYITIGNETKTLQQWSETSGVKANTILCRIRKGIPPEVAIFTEPAGRNMRYKKFK